MNSLLAASWRSASARAISKRVLERDGLRDVAGDDDRGDRRLTAVVERLAPRLDGDPVSVLVAHAKPRRGGLTFVEDLANGGDHDGLVVVVHVLERGVTETILRGDPVHRLARRTDLEHDGVAVDEGDRVDRGVDDRAHLGDVLGERGLGLGRFGDVARDEDGARRWTVRVAQRAPSRLERDLVSVGVLRAKLHRRHLVDLEGLA